MRFCDYVSRVFEVESLQRTEEDKSAVRYTFAKYFSRSSLARTYSAAHFGRDFTSRFSLRRRESIHLLEWPVADEKLIDCEMDARVCKVNALVAEIWKARTAKQMKPKDELASVTITADFDLADFAEEVKSIAKAKQFEIKKRASTRSLLSEKLCYH